MQSSNELYCIATKVVHNEVVAKYNVEYTYTSVLKQPNIVGHSTHKRTLTCNTHLVFRKEAKILFIERHKRSSWKGRVTPLDFAFILPPSATRARFCSQE